MDFRDKDKIFIPLTLVRSRNKIINEWTPLKVIVFLTFGIGMTILTRVNYDRFKGIRINGELWFVILSLILIWYITIWLIRKFAIKEKVLLDMYQIYHKHEITDTSIFWGIYSIRDKIHYLDGTSGLLIKCERGYTKGRPPYWETLHFESITRFIRHMIKNNLHIRYYSNVIDDANTGPLDKTERRINQNKASGVYEMESKVIKYLREITQGISETEEDYFLIQCKDINMESHFEDIVKEGIAMLQDTIFTNVHLCSKQEIYEFEQNYFGLSYINTYRMNQQVFKNSKKKLVTVLERVYSNEVTPEAFERIGKQEAESEYKEAVDNYNKMLIEKEKKDKAEHEAKVRWILERKGYNVDRISARKFKYLSSKITNEEMLQADKYLNKLRQAKKEELSRKKEILMQEQKMAQVRRDRAKFNADIVRNDKRRIRLEDEDTKGFMLDAQVALAREVDSANTKQVEVDNIDDDLII